MIDTSLMLAGGLAIVFVAAIGVIVFDACARRCLECRRRFAIYPFRRCRRHRVRS